jgi:ribulose-phosphate 3-epimerase
MSAELIPAILVKDRKTFLERLKSVEGVASMVQIDCMDGHFVNNRTWYEAESMETTLGIELHLMVSDPLSTIHAWHRIPQLVRVIWHIEIPVDHMAIINECDKLGIERGLAISPKTPVEKIAPYLESLDEVLILGVEPGFSGQPLITSTLEKIPAIKRINPAVQIGFDGGVTQENLATLIHAGVDRINLASAIFQAKDPRETLRAILSNI